jgi:uncharacterized protein (TIGR00251 family)
MQKRRKAARRESVTVVPGCIIEIHTIPRSANIDVQPQAQNTYRIKLTAPPVDGQANHQLILTLSRQLGIARQQIEIISGHHSRQKRVKIIGLTGSTVHQLLSGL